MDIIIAWKKFDFVLSDRSDYNVGRLMYQEFLRMTNCLLYYYSFFNSPSLKRTDKNNLKLSKKLIQKKRKKKKVNVR